MILESDSAMTNPITLTSGCLVVGTTTTVQIKADYIGLLKKIRIFLEGDEGYRCSKFIIQNYEGNYEFECTKPIKPCGIRCGIEIDVNGLIPYNVAIRTDDDKDSGTTSPIEIILIGTKGASPQKMFSEIGARFGSMTEKTLNLNDLGEVTGYNLFLTAQGKWQPVSLMVENLSIIVLIFSNEKSSYIYT
jgi:hypothetical protein